MEVVLVVSQKKYPETSLSRQKIAEKFALLQSCTLKFNIDNPTYPVWKEIHVKNHQFCYLFVKFLGVKLGGSSQIVT